MYVCIDKSGCDDSAFGIERLMGRRKTFLDFHCPTDCQNPIPVHCQCAMLKNPPLLIHGNEIACVFD
jgi:hypothetical protein